ncbi:hypothetical protein V6N13_121232 [Hibiscus sabdariffa]
MKTSQDTMQGFYASHPELADGPILVVQVLTTGYWPIQTSITYHLPSRSSVHIILELIPVGDWPGKQTWGQTDIKATFGKGPKHELNVSTYKMCVLMLFNNAYRLSNMETEQVTGIPASDMIAFNR